MRTSIAVNNSGAPYLRMGFTHEETTKLGIVDGKKSRRFLFELRGDTLYATRTTALQKSANGMVALEQGSGKYTLTLDYTGRHKDHPASVVQIPLRFLQLAGNYAPGVHVEPLIKADGFAVVLPDNVLHAATVDRQVKDDREPERQAKMDLDHQPVQRQRQLLIQHQPPDLRQQRLNLANIETAITTLNGLLTAAPDVKLFINEDGFLGAEILTRRVLGGKRPRGM